MPSAGDLHPLSVFSQQTVNRINSFWKNMTLHELSMCHVHFSESEQRTDY